MHEELPYLLVAVVCTGSLLAWGFAWKRTVLGGPGLFAAQSEPPMIPAATVGLVLVCLVLTILPPLLEHLAAQRGDALAPDRSPTLFDVQFQLAFNVVLVGVLTASLMVLGVPLCQAGFRRPTPLQFVRDAVLGFLLAMGPTYIALVLSERLQLRGQEPEHELLRMLAADGSFANWFWIAVTAVIGAPLAEELLFRVLLQGWLERWTTPATAIALSAVLFCAAHRFPDSLALLPLALVLGYIQHRRQSYLTIVAIHAAFNAFNLVLTAVSNGKF
jgi:hypothetical protein